MELPAESRQRLEIVVHSLSSFLDIYKNLLPITNFFIDMMRCRKETMMGPDKWDEVSRKVTKEHAKSMFNFKEGPKD